ncbi:MAG: metallophosphoesterase [Proteobacteria bacterium]|nr:metallophosphoesterase [Pseudomonadota bacterium]
MVISVRTSVSTLLAVACGLSRAYAGGQAAGDRVYVAAGSHYSYVAVEAPLPARQLGPIALAGLRSLRDPAVIVPSVTGQLRNDQPGSGGGAEPSRSAIPLQWPSRPLVGRAGNAPFGAMDKQGSCRCETAVGDTRLHRVAALYVTRSFAIGDEIASLRMLRLRARYRDGLVAYINGREVARRNFDQARGPMDVARRPRGPEWETFHIAVVPGMLHRGDNLLAVEVHPSGNRLAPHLDVELTSSQRGRIVRGPMVQRVTANSAVMVFETDLPVAGAVEYGPTAELGLVARSAGGGLAMRHVVELHGLPAGQAVYYRVVTDAGTRRQTTIRQTIRAALQPVIGPAPQPPRTGPVPHNPGPDRAERTGLHAALDRAGRGPETTGPPALQGRVFHTAPAPGDVIRFAVYGDVRGGHRTHGALVASIVNEAPDFVVVTGDLVLRGTDEGDWQRFFAITGQLLATIPYYPVAGNHDMGRSGDQRRRMNEIFELWPGPENRPSWGHWYSFDVGDVHFVMLDSNAYQYHEQLVWLEQDLRAARERGVRAIFAAVHHGPYSRGLHRGHQYAAETYAPVLARYGTTLTFSGHDHLYQRGEVDGFAYIVSGGGGAPLYSVRCGVGRKRRCKIDDGMQYVASEHHYVMITVYPGHMQVCPKRVDGAPLEECITYRLSGNGRPSR